MVQCGDVISVVDLRVVEKIEAHLEMDVGCESMIFTVYKRTEQKENMEKII